MSDAAIDRSRASAPVFPVLGAISFCHMLNDTLQALLPAIYPLLKGGFDLSFTQIGLLTLVFQVTASLLQPVVGCYTDRKPWPFSLQFGMGASLLGLVLLAFDTSYPMLLAGAALLGTGSSVFHPESSRLARLASGVQVIAVTHAPQVAARAERHYLISKAALGNGKRVATRILELAAERLMDLFQQDAA